MKGLLRSFLFTIVAAFQVQLAAGGPWPAREQSREHVATSEEVPVRGGIEAIALALDIAPVPDRGRFVSEVTRLVLGIPGRKTIPTDVVVRRLKNLPAGGNAANDVVPVPLTTSVWSAAVFHRSIAPGDLVAAILSDPRAALLGHGLASLDDETLEYLGAHPSLIGDLYEHHAAAFGAFAGSLHIRAGGVVTPGGDAAIPLWEAALARKVTEPDRFVLELFAHAEGRTAYLYNTIGQLEAPRAAFALGLWMEEGNRLPAMKALVASWAAAFGDWRLNAQPFARQPYDAAALLMRVRVDGAGAPLEPSSRTFWTASFENADLPDNPEALLNAAVPDRPVDAAWLIEMSLVGEGRRRGDRLDQLAFGQRVFGSAPAAGMPDALIAVRTFPRYRMLMLTLDRLGIRAPALYAAAARHAARLSSLDGRRAFVATAQFQGALAILLRMTLVGTIDSVEAQKLVTSLVAVPLDVEGRYAGAVARWIREALRPALPTADTMEASLVAALSGDRNGGTLPRIQWEGQPYHLDLAGTERRRLERVREKQRGASVDLALDLAERAHAFSSSSPTMAQLTALTVQLDAIAKELPAKSMRDNNDWFPPGVAPPPDARDVVGRSIDQLRAIEVAKDFRRFQRVGHQVAEIADEVMAQTLVSVVYAANIGDPDGTALLVGDVSPRHDFGFGARDGDARVRAPWGLPRQDVAPGVPWHVDGSLLGLEIALAPLQLRRLDMDRAMAPSITSNQRETFAMSVALLNTFALDDAARDAMVEAIENGRRRIASVGQNRAGFDAAADAIAMDGSRRRAGRWMLEHEPDRLESLFSLDELLRLGDARGAIDLDPWGMAAIASSGCICTEMPPPGRWQAMTGRPQVGVLATTMADLNLHVARTLKELHLPSRLTKFVLAAAMQDFIDDARPTDPDDWLTLVRAAQSVPRRRIEDYVAAATVDGPLVPDDAIASSPSER